MTVEQLLLQLNTAPETVEFDQVMAVIDQHYDYTPARFTNGARAGDAMVVNEAGTNEGSCRIFAFAQLNHLSAAETLACFGAYYREDVTGEPDGDNHGNIRRFMVDGWAGIHFDGEVLAPN